LTTGGWGLGETAGFGLSGSGLKGGGSSDSGLGFLALKKMSGQRMVVKSYEQFQEL
jgi:hypothetical protein